MQSTDLSTFDNSSFSRGAPGWKDALWRLVSAFIFKPSWIHLPGIKCTILRGFGANIGKNVNIKPEVKITFPWRLEIGDYSWIGEEVWIDNLDYVRIGSHCCISQGVYLCTGNHDWSKKSFDLKTKPIILGEGVWLGAKSVVGPGVTAGHGSILTMGGVAKNKLQEGWIYTGNPAVAVRRRES